MTGYAFTMPPYVFAESPEELESQRLTAMEQECDPGTFRRIAALGLNPGDAFLELGPGRGSVAAWACQRVGSGGRVVAIDLQPRFLSGLLHANLEIRSGDIRTLELETSAYDFVHARNVLLHLPDYEPVFDKLVAAAKPGGWLLIEDLDLSTQRPATGDQAGAALIRTAFAAIADFHLALGIHVDMGCRLPALFRRAGIECAGVETELPLVPGGSATATALALTVRQIAPALLIPEEAIRRFLELLDDPGAWMMHAARIAAWGWKTGVTSSAAARTTR